jgi:tRNA threonylcarbamoyladenosine biosynthesis protein TsaB
LVMLGIDSSDDFISVGLADSGKILISRSSEPETRNKNMIHSFITDVLKEGGKNIDDLGSVAVAIGPGSFTGLRVGLATAKGICWPLGLRLVGVSSLLAVAKCARISVGKILAVKDAKRSEFYYAGYLGNNGSLKQLISDTAGSAQDIIELIRDGYVVAGPGIEELRKHLSSQIDSIAEYDRHGLGGAVALLGLDMIIKGETLDLATSAPNYIRTPKPKEWKSE